jgi:hypothetical protein
VARERTDDAACRRFPLRRVIFAPGSQRLTAAAKQARANRKSFHPGQVFVEIRAGGIILRIRSAVPDARRLFSASLSFSQTRGGTRTERNQVSDHLFSLGTRQTVSSEAEDVRPKNPISTRGRVNSLPVSNGDDLPVLRNEPTLRFGGGPSPSVGVRALIEVGSCARTLWTRPKPTTSVTQTSASITTLRCVIPRR